MSAKDAAEPQRHDTDPGPVRRLLRGWPWLLRLGVALALGWAVAEIPESLTDDDPHDWMLPDWLAGLWEVCAALVLLSVLLMCFWSTLEAGMAGLGVSIGGPFFIAGLLQLVQINDAVGEDDLFSRSGYHVIDSSAEALLDALLAIAVGGGILAIGLYMAWSSASNRGQAARKKRSRPRGRSGDPRKSGGYRRRR